MGPGDRTRSLAGVDDGYESWLAAREIAWIADSCARLDTIGRRPVLSVIVPTYETPAPFLRACIDSVLAQTYGEWELCIADDGSRTPEVRDVLSDYARRDPRICVELLPTNGGIALATNTALALARGDYVAFLDHDDTLAPFALADVAIHLHDHAETDLLYSDEDRIDPKGRRVRPFFKPNWSPDLLRACNYVCHFLVVRRELVSALGGIRPGFDGAQDYDLVLRATEKARRVGHVPRVLYHWRATATSTARDVATKPGASDAGVKALREHLLRRDEDGDVDAPEPTQYRVRYRIKGSPLVTVVVTAAQGRLDRLQQTLGATRHSDLQLLVVGGALSPERVSWDGEPRIAAMRNRAIAHARGDFLVFLHDDVEIVDRTWLDELLGHAQRPDVGVVGTKLVYPDGTIQHAGLVVGLGGLVGRPFAHMTDANAWTSMGATTWTRNYLAVSGACLMVRKSHLDAVGGFDQRLGDIAATVDLCLRLGAHGLRTVYTPHTRLLHHGCDDTPSPGELDALRPLQRFLHDGDPFYNPNLSPCVGDGRLRERFADPELDAVLRRLVDTPAAAANGAVDQIRHALDARERSLLALQALLRQKNAQIAEMTARLDTLAAHQAGSLQALARRELDRRPRLKATLKRLLGR